MQIKTKIEVSKIKNVFILFVFVAVGVFFALENINADKTSIIDGLSQQTTKEQDENNKKIEELEKRAEIYRDIIDIKKKQSATLNDQLSIADSNIALVQTQIDDSKQKINDLNSQILRVEKQIKEKEALMESQKKILAGMIQSYYEVNLASPVVVYLNDSNLASFIVKKDRIAQTGDKIREMVISLKNIKNELESQIVELEKKKEDIVAARDNLNEKSDNLESIKTQKETLLAQTKGEEARYQQLLARVETQKQELLDIDQFFSASGLSVDSYPKPDTKYFASTGWYFSQRDPRWGNETIGNTKTLMKSYGCAVTAVAMVFEQHGGSTNPGKLSSAPIFSGDLINWPPTWTNPKVALTSNGKNHGNINWGIIDAQIAKNNPVIVYIARSKGGGHYVVIHHKTKEGKYVVHDPYFGANLFLDTSRTLVGAMGASSPTSINQMIIYN